jgi:hypothetical protein
VGPRDAYAARVMGIFPPLPSEREQATLTLPVVRRGLKRTRTVACIAQKMWEDELERLTQMARDMAEEA